MTEAATTKDVMQPLFKLAAQTPLNIAPERGQELATEIFGNGKWELLPSETAANFYAVPYDKAIYLSYAGLASLWCVAYAAFHVSDIASRVQQSSKGLDQTEANIGEEFASRQIAEHIAYAEALIRSDASWPANVSRPNVDAKFDSIEGRVKNVFFGALSWIILHETAHVHHGDQKFIPAALLVKQEYRADDFATRWILDEAGSGLQREFRVLMIIVALTWLFLHERAVGKGTDHPPVILRFREAVKLFQMGERSVGLQNAAYVLKALLDPATFAPPHETAKDYFKWVCSRLETLYGTNNQ